MSQLILLLLLIGVSRGDLLSAKQTEPICNINGLNLYGKVKVVEYRSQADISVKLVNSYPKLAVKIVSNFADSCGKWQLVEFGENFTVFFSEFEADLKVQFVNNEPGLKQ